MKSLGHKKEYNTQPEKKNESENCFGFKAMNETKNGARRRRPTKKLANEL